MGESKLFTPLKIEPHVLTDAGIEEVRRHPASYAEQNLVATIDRFRQKLESVGEICVRHGYNKESEDMAEWLDKHLNVTVMPNEKAQRAWDKMQVYALEETLKVIAGDRAELQLRYYLLHERLDQLEADWRER